MAAYGWMSGEGKRELLSRLRPPDDVRLKLAPLRGLCTYTLLEELRYGQYEAIHWDCDNVTGDVTDWFDTLRQTTSEWNIRPRSETEVMREGLERGNMFGRAVGVYGGGVTGPGQGYTRPQRTRPKHRGSSTPLNPCPSGWRGS